MQIKFSRHAKRRAKLYGLSEDNLKLILEDADIVTTYPLKKGVSS
jgi:hypothetical protein